jgi:hypothetical protein
MIPIIGGSNSLYLLGNRERKSNLSVIRISKMSFCSGKLKIETPDIKCISREYTQIIDLLA